MLLSLRPIRQGILLHLCRAYFIVGLCFEIKFAIEGFSANWAFVSSHGAVVHFIRDFVQSIAALSVEACAKSAGSAEHSLT